MVTFVNQGWLRFTGTTLQEELGESWALGVHPDDAEPMLVSWEEALARARPWQGEYRLKHHTGEYRWIDDRGVPRYVGEHYAGYVGTAIDIHERKTMEGRLIEVYQREHRIAETLQRSLLPERLPPIEGVAIARRYLPGGRGRRRRRRLVRRARAAPTAAWRCGRRRGRPRPPRRGARWASCATRSAPTGWSRARPPRWWRGINRLVMSGVERVMATRALPACSTARPARSRSTAPATRRRS